MFSAISLVALLSILPAAFAQSPVYGQFAIDELINGLGGGTGWSGATTCASGSSCVYSNPYYSQCLPGAAPPTTTTPPAPPPPSTPTTPTSTQGGASPTSGATCPGPKTKFQYFGVNESGAEFGSTTWPGELGKDYTWPAPSSIDYFVENGFNVFRVTFLMERMNPPATGLLGPFNETYLDGLTTTVSYITEQGAFAIIDPHNYMRYDNAIISSTTEFQSWWQSLATVFATNPNVIFDVQNEPYGIDAGTVFDLNQAAINGIRASGATSQLILVEGTSYTGAWTWISSGNGAVFGAIQDPSNNVAVEMHQYLDSDGSGTSATCVNNTIGVDRLQSATQWLQENNLKGFLGEIGAGSNSDCAEAVAGALCLMQQSDVWIGASWWAAGPWWGTTYYQSIEPPSGPAVATFVPLLQSFQ